MKTSSRCLVSLLALSVAVAASAAEMAVPFRRISFDEATQVAAKEGKVVFVDFYTTWCGPCKMLDAQTFTDAAVGKLVGEKAVAIKLDAEKEGRATAQRYKVSAYPTLLLTKADGTEIDRIIGFREPAKFIAEFSDALAGKTAIVRAMKAVEDAGETVDRDTVKARHDLGRTLAQKGDDAGALREFLWCFDEGMVKVSSFAGVRTSFLLGDLGRLSKRYPPAREALLERCAAAEQRVLRDPRDTRSVTEFAALCAELGDDTRMLGVFDSLPRDDPRLRGFGLRAFRVLLPQQRYADALRAMPPDSMFRLVELNINRPPSMNDPRVLESSRRFTVNTMLDYIETLAGANDATHAEEMVAKLKKFDESEETNRKIEERLLRARTAVQ
jgi:thiol-disulfide isomerase/thioredoxin